MKIIVTGSLGHISKPLTEELVQKGHEVIVVSSKAERQKEIEALGAKAAIGSVDDVEFLTKTFRGADAVYTMIPPSQHGFSDPNFDMLARWTQVTNNLAEAVEKSGIKRVVHLSSIGAHMAKDSGILVGHYEAEATFNKLKADVTFMRPVGFYYNLLGFIPVIKSMGMIASNYGGDAKKPWVSPIDIAAAIAAEIVTPLTGHKVVYVASDEISCNEIAHILGEAIGKPDLKWVIISNEQMLDAMKKAGMPETLVKGFVEMNAAIQSGVLYEDYYRHQPVLGKVKVKDYAKQFAAVFNQGGQPQH